MKFRKNYINKILRFFSTTIKLYIFIKMYKKENMFHENYVHNTNKNKH